MTTDEALRLLGVTEEAALSQAAIEKAYKKARFINHPDKGGNHEQFVRVGDAYATLVANLRRVIVIPEFTDPGVIEYCRRIENKARNGDIIHRKVYETMRAFPGVAWPSVWPPAEDPVLTLTPVGVSGGAVTSGVQEAASKQEKKRKRKEEKRLESYNKSGKVSDEPVDNKGRCVRPPQSTDRVDVQAPKSNAPKSKAPKSKAPKSKAEATCPICLDRPVDKRPCMGGKCNRCGSYYKRRGKDRPPGVKMGRAKKNE